VGTEYRKANWLVVAAVAALVGLGTAAATWRQLAIAWHRRGLEDCKGVADRQWTILDKENCGISWTGGYYIGRMPSPPAMYRTMNKFTGFPANEYFTEENQRRANYHTRALHKLGDPETVASLEEF
jgi:hypothetical protein